MSGELHKILTADRPMTLAGVPSGFMPWLAADLARAAKGRAVFVSPDEGAMLALDAGIGGGGVVH